MAAATKPRLLDIPGVGLKQVDDLGSGSRIAYSGDVELLAIVKSFANRQIVVTEHHVFVVR